MPTGDGAAAAQESTFILTEPVPTDSGPSTFCVTSVGGMPKASTQAPRSVGGSLRREIVRWSEGDLVVEDGRCLADVEAGSAVAIAGSVAVKVSAGEVDVVADIEVGTAVVVVVVAGAVIEVFGQRCEIVVAAVAVAVAGALEDSPGILVVDRLFCRSFYDVLAHLSHRSWLLCGVLLELLQRWKMLELLLQLRLQQLQLLLVPCDKRR
mmetsp:Transcript_61931/g.130791  ORF Transcript_61931/g.130791 Transcript_61931/m.130791 type:complete len:209 (-) Transcript_61931:626-1252(-)